MLSSSCLGIYYLCLSELLSYRSAALARLLGVQRERAECLRNVI
jgi:hypothetical protein